MEKTLTRELGIVGLGRMGGGLAAQALEGGTRVVGLTEGKVPAELEDAGLVPVDDAAGFRARLAPSRAVVLYVPAGDVVDQVLADLREVLEPGDVVADGGNSYWGDSRRRGEELARDGLEFVDLGTSGGVDGARHGACFMMGGSPRAIDVLQPVPRPLAVEGGWVHAGPVGTGHFVKLVHNGIEFGMLQAIGEGVSLLEAHEESLPVADVLRCWRHGSVIRSWLVDLMEQEYRARGGTTDVPSHVEDTGEVNWLVADAMQMERPVPVIAQAVMQLFASRDEERSWARAVAMMRHGFGGHPLGPDDSIAEERRNSRVELIVSAGRRRDTSTDSSSGGEPARRSP